MGEGKGCEFGDCGGDCFFVVDGEFEGGDVDGVEGEGSIWRGGEGFELRTIFPESGNAYSLRKNSAKTKSH